MNFLPIIGDVIGNLFGIGRDYLEGKRKLKQAEMDAKIHVEKTKLSAVIDWNQQALINAQSSWKDEYLLILFSIPLILCFVPEFGPPIVADGFAVLKETPDWYKASLGVMVAGSYGYQKLTKFFGAKNGN